MNKFIIPFVVLAVSVSGDVGSEPLVSVGKIKDLLSESFALTSDIVQFAAYKIEDSLSDDSKKVYHDFLQHCSDYKRMVTNYASHHPIAGPASRAWTWGSDFVSHHYERVNNLSSRIVDPIVNEFATKYPKSAKWIGRSVIDRVLMGFWVLWVIKFALRVVWRILKVSTTSRKM